MRCVLLESTVRFIRLRAALALGASWIMAADKGSGTSGSEPVVVRATCVPYVGMFALSARARDYRN